MINDNDQVMLERKDLASHSKFSLSLKIKIQCLNSFFDNFLLHCDIAGVKQKCCF